MLSIIKNTSGTNIPFVNINTVHQIPNFIDCTALDIVQWFIRYNVECYLLWNLAG